MKIRRATALDADEIARIVNAAFEIEQEFRRGDRTSSAEVLTSISMEHEIFLVAEDGGRLVGAVEVRLDGEAGYFGMLAVDASVRRGGIGRALVEAAEAHCREAGCSVMTIQCPHILKAAGRGALRRREQAKQAPFARHA
jgi:ribosomal protein S18 acetylase RimI-like enzyme